MEPTELRGALEAILFVSNEPVKVDDLAESFPDEGKDAVIAQLEEIRRLLDANLGGFMLEQTAGGWRLATRAEHDSVLRKFFSKKGENRLSIAALETMAIVAYRQPITAPEVSEIRGVNATGVIRTLLERRMIRVAGRKNVVGSPFLYRTTREFLVHFGLNDIRDLPRLEEFGDLIGENINDDLVAAIAAAPEGDASAVVEGTDLGENDATTGEAALAVVERDERAGTSADRDEVANDDSNAGANDGETDLAHDDAHARPTMTNDDAHESGTQFEAAIDEEDAEVARGIEDAGVESPKDDQRE
jgi:segregation and condensation protein B